MNMVLQVLLVGIGTIGFASMLSSSSNTSNLRTNSAILDVGNAKQTNFVPVEEPVPVQEENRNAVEVKQAAPEEQVKAEGAQTEQKSPKDKVRALQTHEGGTENLRVAVFGSSNAWGAALEDRFNAYPFLLSKRVHNYAHYATGPNYYATCLQTVLGDDNIYDVIILDYWLKYHQGLAQLARRLRQRFPKAILIFIKVWSPIHFHRKSAINSDDDQTLAQWKSSAGLNDEDLQTFINAVTADTGYWYFPEHNNADEAIAKIAYQEGGYTFSFPFKEEGAQETLIGYLGLYDEFSHSHVSKIGHEAIARNLKHIVDTNNEQTHDEIVNSQTHGMWGKGDQCHMWYSTGMASSLELSENLKMVEFDVPAGKFAIELHGEGTLTIINPFEGDERTLYLSFMTSDVEGVYPNVTVSAYDWEYTLDPLNTENPKFEVETVDVGKLMPGGNTLHFTPQFNTSSPFRLLGASFTDGYAIPEKYGFGPTYHHKIHTKL